MPEAVLTHKLKVKETEPPALCLFLIDGEYKMAYVVGEGVRINTQAHSVLDSLVVLLAVYYVFDLNYPAMYGQLLGFLQQHVLEEPYTYFKGSNFKTFSARVGLNEK